MANHFCKYPLWDVMKDLTDTAMGYRGADLVIKNAKLVNVCTKEIIENTDVAITLGRIALVGDATKCIKENTKIIEANGKYLAPSFIDAHMHIESSMIKVSEYAKAAMKCGTSVIYADPHEMANVLGFEAVKLMIEESRTVPLKTMFTIPSCVPAVEAFEDIGSKKIVAEDIKEAMKWPEVVGLGEMMNFPGIIYGNEEVQAIVKETLKADKIPTGHFSIPNTSNELNAYIASGVRNCHESTRAIDALSKMRLGMYALFREGSGWKDLINLAKALTENKVDSRYACLVSDDTHPNTLISEGHMNSILKKAVEYGIDPIEAVQMVTINPATCYRIEHELGSIAPSKCADIVILEDLKDFKVTTTIIDGEIVYDNDEIQVKIKDYEYPSWVKNSIHLKEEITKDSFKITVDKTGEVNVRVMEVSGGKVDNKELIVKMPIVDGELLGDSANDVLKVMVFERHHKTGKVGKGFIKGFNIKNGAMASTVAHDAHNLMVIGTNDEDMAIAANALINSQGGMVTVSNGEIIGHVELEIAGLMSNEPIEKVAHKVEILERSWEKLGCDMPSPFMTMAIVSLACIPDLRLTNRGLVDCNKFELVNLIVE